MKNENKAASSSPVNKMPRLVRLLSPPKRLSPKTFDENHYYNLAEKSYKQGDNNGAINNLATALKMRPKFPEALCLRGLVELRKKPYDSAVLSFEAAIKLQSKYPKAYQGLGSAYYKLGMHAAAIAALKKAIEQENKSHETYQILGSAYYKLGQNANAIAALEKAIDQGNNSPTTHDYLSQLYFKKFELSDSLVDLKKSRVHTEKSTELRKKLSADTPQKKPESPKSLPSLKQPVESKSAVPAVRKALSDISVNTAGKPPTKITSLSSSSSTVNTVAKPAVQYIAPLLITQPLVKEGSFHPAKGISTVSRTTGQTQVHEKAKPPLKQAPRPAAVGRLSSVPRIKASTTKQQKTVGEIDSRMFDRNRPDNLPEPDKMIVHMPRATSLSQASLSIKVAAPQVSSQSSLSSSTALSSTSTDNISARIDSPLSFVLPSPSDKERRFGWDLQ